MTVDYIKEIFLKPRVQGLAIFIFGLVCLPLFKLASAGVSVTSNYAWLTGGAMLLFYAVLNNLMVLTAAHLGKYIQESLLVFIVMLIALSLVAYAVSGKSIFEAGSYRSIYVVLVVGHLTLLAVSIFIRTVINYIKEKDKQIHGDH